MDIEPEFPRLRRSRPRRRLSPAVAARARMGTADLLLGGSVAVVWSMGLGALAATYFM